MKDVLPATLMAGGATFPIWNWFSGFNEMLISLAGIIALILTILIKAKDLKIKSVEQKIKLAELRRLETLDK